MLSATLIGQDGSLEWIYNVPTASEHQGKGLGRKIILATKILIKTNGVLEIQLMVRDMNTQAISFYQQLGFNLKPSK